MAETDAPSYRVRRTAFEKEVTWRLDPDALVVAPDGGAPLRIPYRDIAELRLSYDPTRLDSDRHRCEITTAGGLRRRIVSTAYVGIAQFESRAASYRPFVRELIGRVAAAAPSCRFVAGRRRLVYIAEHAFLVAMVLLLAAVLVLTGVPIAGVVMAKLALIAVWVPIALRYARVNWPRPFDPHAIPADLLPD